MIKSESISKLAPALVKAQAEMGNASKGASNPFFKSRYSDLNSVREACIPVLTKHGLSVLQPTITVDGKKFVETLVLHESGEFIGGHTEILSVKELDAQAQGSGISYARRYGLQSLLCIGSEDDDGNSASGKEKPAYTNNVGKSVTSTQPVNVSTVKEATVTLPNNSIVTTAKAGGFGVKKAKVETTENEEWS